MCESDDTFHFFLSDVTYPGGRKCGCEFRHPLEHYPLCQSRDDRTEDRNLPSTVAIRYSKAGSVCKPRIDDTETRQANEHWAC